MQGSRLLMAAVVGLGLLGARGAEARSPATPGTVSRQASPAAQAKVRHPGHAAQRQAARRDPAADNRACGRATVSMFYSRRRAAGHVP